MATILVIDDNETIRFGLRQVIKKIGHTVLVAASGAEGIALLKKDDVDFIITDLKMEGLDGRAVLAAAAEHDPDCPTMIITAFGTVDTAVEAMKHGAFDFLQKPFTPELVRLKVERALALRAERKARKRLECENDYLRGEEGAAFGDIVGASPAMRPIFHTIERVAPTSSSVLILGESGTGKELVARAIHTRSARRNGPFIKVNCGAITDSLLESELFGHEKGSFTGAIKRRLGRFELADGGTLFLDEVGDVSPAMQLKLLRVLQEQEFERVGGERSIKVDVRILSATNKDMAALVRAGQFREDLFYRLHVVPLVVPPLRERREDIPLLVDHFLGRLRGRTGSSVVGLADDALARLIAHDWPGNVRELENTIEQALVFAEGPKITARALPEQLSGTQRGTLELPRQALSLPEILEDLERQLILKAYAEAGGVKTETARRLGIKTSALYYKLEKYGIDG